MEGDMKAGVVIIKLPPPESSSEGKTIAAAFAFANPDDQLRDQQALAEQEEEDDHDSPPADEHDRLPLHHRPLPHHRRSARIFRRLRSRRFASFIFIALVAYSIWRYGPSSLKLDDDSSNSKQGERAIVYSIYSKLLVSKSLNSSLASQSIPAYPDPANVSPSAVTKLVQRDGMRNHMVGSEAAPDADVERTSTTVFPVRGDVYPHGLYYVTLMVGTPPKQYFLDLDTGSDLTWLQCDAPCTSCAKGPHALYKPRKANLVDSKEDICSSVQSGGNFGPKQGSSQCDYEIQYADGGSSLGVLVRDGMTLLLTNGSWAQTKAVFGCAYDQQGPLAKSPSLTDGVLGLSSSTASLPSQLAGQGLIKNILSHCISGNSRGGGYLFFGDKLLPSWGITWAPMLGKPSARNYALAVENIYFGDAAINIGDALGSAIFDSGTSYTYLVSPVYAAIVSIITKSLVGSGLQQDESDDTLPLCWRGSSPFRSLEDVQHLFNTITLAFKGSGWLSKTSNLQISPEGYLIVNSKGNVCFGILDVKVLGDHNANILGDISMQGHLVVYDNENSRMGWMKTDCRKLPSAAILSPSL